MKKISFFLLFPFILFFFSCTNRTPLQQLIHETDVVKIFIYSSSGATSLHYETNDLKKISNWHSYIDETAVGTLSCNDYEGKLIFKVYEDSTVMKFSLKEGCRQVVYESGDSVLVKKLTKEGIDFINSLRRIN